MKRYLLLLPAALLIFSCKKASTATADSVTVDGKIIYTGSIAADGCEWLVVVDTVTHQSWHPANLDAAYLINNLKVQVTYHKIHTNWQCGQVALTAADADKVNTIYIDAISKR